jgi:hypothetical protein
MFIAFMTDRPSDYPQPFFNILQSRLGGRTIHASIVGMSSAKRSSQ